MNDTPRYVTLRDYLRVIRQHRLVIVLVAFAFAGAAVAYSLRQDTVYTAETSLEFQSENIDTSVLGTFVVDQGGTPEQNAAISAQQVGRPQVAERARDILDTRISVGFLARSVTALPEARTNLVVITARWSDAKFAARIADAFGSAARDIAIGEARRRYSRAAAAKRRVMRALGNSQQDRVTRSFLLADVAQLQELSRAVRPVQISRRAEVPTTPVSPRPVRNTVLALLLGIIVGTLAAFGRDSLDRRFRGSREITEELKLPLIGHVHEDLLGRSVVQGNGLAPLDAAEFEGFRILRTNIEFLEVDNPPKVLLVTSAVPEEGKSTVAAALAAAYATAGKRTALVECDLRRPSLAGRLGLQEKPGLTDYLVGQATPAEVLQTVHIPSVSSLNGATPTAESRGVPMACIVAGSSSPQPAELLRSERARSFFAQISEAYDIVVVDTCPLLAVVDTLDLLPLAEGVVMCVRASQTTRDQARAAKAALEHMPDRPTGVVITGMRVREDEASGYYSYGYAYQSPAER